MPHLTAMRRPARTDFEIAPKTPAAAVASDALDWRARGTFRTGACSAFKHIALPEKLSIQVAGAEARAPSSAEP